jgi:hypothetical protein
MTAEWILAHNVIREHRKLIKTATHISGLSIYKYSYGWGKSQHKPAWHKTEITLLNILCLLWSLFAAYGQRKIQALRQRDCSWALRPPWMQMGSDRFACSVVSDRRKVSFANCKRSLRTVFQFCRTYWPIGRCPARSRSPSAKTAAAPYSIFTCSVLMINLQSNHVQIVNFSKNAARCTCSEPYFVSTFAKKFKINISGNSHF